MYLSVQNTHTHLKPFQKCWSALVLYIVGKQLINCIKKKLPRGVTKMAGRTLAAIHQLRSPALDAQTGVNWPY